MITLNETTSLIIHAVARVKTVATEESEKNRIITTAAKIIKTDIEAVITEKDLYPLPEDVCSLEKNTEY